MKSARLPDSAHTSRPWRIHELTPDFRLEDVWELPGRGRAEDFPRLVEVMTSMDPSRNPSRAARALFAMRRKLGELFGWDEPEAGAEPPTLRDRLPPDLRGGPAAPEPGALPFTPLYITDDEYAAEAANRTVHAVMHLGAVGEPSGGVRAQMAVLVKPNGRFGEAYMAAIKPFRHLIVYPPMLREGGRAWARARRPGEA